MRFIVERDALADGVMWVSRSLSARPIMPVLLGVLINADKKGVHGTHSSHKVSGGLCLYQSRSHNDAHVIGCATHNENHQTDRERARKCKSNPSKTKNKNTDQESPSHVASGG